MLSRDLSTLIGGRYKEIYIQALSYEEFMLFHQLSDSDDTLAKYIQFGGLPGLVKMGLDEQDAREYQLDVYHTVLLKDVIMRNQIRNVPFLENLVRFLADNTGKIISANSIAKYMKSQGDRITSTVIINYTKFLCEAYLIYKVVGRNDLLTPPFTLCRNQNVSSLVSGWLNGSVSLVSTVTSIDGFSCSTLRLPKFRKSILLADTFSCD